MFRAALSNVLPWPFRTCGALRCRASELCHSCCTLTLVWFASLFALLVQGARVLPQVPEGPPCLHRCVLERCGLGQRTCLLVFTGMCCVWVACVTAMLLTAHAVAMFQAAAIYAANK